MSITDELRAMLNMTESINSADIQDLYEIADRIDEQHEEAIKELSADFEGQLYCESFVNWAVMDKFAVKQRDLEARVSTIERKLNHKGGAE